MVLASPTPPATSSHSQEALPHKVEDGGRYRIRTYDFHRVRMALYR